MTVERAVQSLINYPVRFLTVHCSGGETMLRSAVNGAGDSGLGILGVTVLTNLGPDDHREELGYRKDITLEDLTLIRAQMAEKQDVPEWSVPEWRSRPSAAILKP